jgi:hypothetical protein
MKKFYDNVRNREIFEQFNMENCADYSNFKQFFNKSEEKSQVDVKINIDTKLKPWWNAECSLIFAKVILATKKFKKNWKSLRLSTKKKD